MAEESRFDSRQEQKICLFSIASTPALEPTEPPVQWVEGAVSTGVKRQGREAGHSPPSRAGVAELYLHPIELRHGVLLN
jgi:hypothetical protein